MKRELATRTDIELLVDSFYEKVKVDPLIGPIFNDVAKVNWPAHLPVMYDFWENTIFFTGNYLGNPMQVHVKLHEHFPLNANHFSRWIRLFLLTVDELFEGEKAELAKQRAHSIATMMQIKLAAAKPGIQPGTV
ncbi:MAG: group III truncated hemoglobin [Bacteroidota bacterium]|nr:group III truncated hemoglobin [Bacteroidota bacterium]